MVFLLNLILAIAAGMLSNYILILSSVKDPVKIILAVLVGIAVFLADFASLIL